MRPIRNSFKRLLWAVPAFGLMALQPAPAFPPGGERAREYNGTDTVLLESPDLVITEQDLLVHILIMESSLHPNHVTWALSGDPQFIPTVRAELDQYMQSHLLAAEAPEPLGAMELDLRRRAIRIFSAPVARWIWVEKVVSEAVRIFPEDIVYLFKSRPQDFFQPESVTIRRLRIPLDPAMPLEAQNEARIQANELRERAINEGGLAEILRTNPELLADPAGRMLEVTRLDTTLEPPVMETVFSLGTRQISQPIRTPSGIYIVEIVERREAEPKPMEEVIEQIKEALYNRFVAQQYNYLVGEKIAVSYPSDRARFFANLPMDADLVRVRDFALTREEFTKLFPEIVGDPRFPSRPAIGGKTGRILSGEVITQDLERQQLLHNDILYQKAEKLAGKIYAAGTYVRSLRAELEPTDAEVREYLEKNREKLTPGSALMVWQFEYSIRNAERLSRGELDAMHILMKSYMGEGITIAQRQFDERRQLAADRGLIEPDTVMRTIPEPDDLRLRTRFTQVGMLDRRTAGQSIEVPFEQLAFGKFTEPHINQSGAVVSYFVSEIAPAAEPTPEELMRAAREALVIELSTRGVAHRVEEMKADGRIKFHPRLTLQTPDAEEESPEDVPPQPAAR